MIIPLEKLVEYKGNKYELAKSMIDLARNGKALLSGETKANNDKYIQTVIKNIVEGKIKFDYKEGSPMSVSEEAPYMHSEEEYDETQFKGEVSDSEEDKIEEDESLENDEDEEEEK